MKNTQSAHLRTQIEVYKKIQQSTKLSVKIRVDAGIQKHKLILKLKELLYAKAEEL